MYLTYRRAQLSDLEDGFPFVAKRYGYDASLRKDMVKLWRALLENDHDPFVVSEDRDKPVGKRVVSFGTSFFAYDWFVQEARTVLPPFLSLRVLEKWRLGQRPFLLKHEILEAQVQEGIHCVAFNWGWAEEGYDPQEVAKIKETQSASFIDLISGYRMKGFTQEVIGLEERDRLANFGVDPWRDYREFLGTQYLPTTMGAGHPYLMGVLMEDVRRDVKKSGTVVHQLAWLGPPRYGFRLSEQVVLKRALLGETDEEIAKGLGLSLVTVKKRWQGLYAKVSEADPELLPEAPGSGTAENPGPKQRRRLLLQNLKTHPEELWPSSGSKKVKVK